MWSNGVWFLDYKLHIDDPVGAVAVHCLNGIWGTIAFFVIKALYTGHIGDGKIFVYNVAKVVKVRTGEEDYAALQDVE